jgi:hypothetical protein
LRVLAIGLAIASPAVAVICAAVGSSYCSQGSTAIGIGEGALWPRCRNAWVAWFLILLPSTSFGILAWVLAITTRRVVQ